MTDERLYTQREIAQTLGISRQGVQKQAGLWPVARTEVRRGQTTRLYSLSTLPPQIRYRLGEAEDIQRYREEVVDTLIELALVEQIAAEIKARKADLKRRLRWLESRS